MRLQEQPSVSIHSTKLLLLATRYLLYIMAGPSPRLYWKAPRQGRHGRVGILILGVLSRLVGPLDHLGRSFAACWTIGDAISPFEVGHAIFPSISILK